MNATASIVKNFISSNNVFFFDSLINEMKFFKNSKTFTHRQTFVGMIKSMLLDFCQIQTAEQNQVEFNGARKFNLIESVVIKHFQNDLVELSQDKVVNVRISLAECFFCLQERLEQLDLEATRIQKLVQSQKTKNKEVNQKDTLYLEQFKQISSKIE